MCSRFDWNILRFGAADTEWGGKSASRFLKIMEICKWLGMILCIQIRLRQSPNLDNWQLVSDINKLNTLFCHDWFILNFDYFIYLWYFKKMKRMWRRGRGRGRLRREQERDTGGGRDGGNCKKYKWLPIIPIPRAVAQILTSIPHYTHSHSFTLLLHPCHLPFFHIQMEHFLDISFS